MTEEELRPVQSDSLHYPDQIVTFQKIMEWKEKQEQLTEEQLRKVGDYLTLKKEVENCWIKEDKKRFIRVKNFLKTQSHVLTDVEKLEMVA